MFSVDLADLLTVRRKQRHRHVYPPLVDHHLQVLTGDHRDLVGMRLTTRQLSFNRLTGFQRIGLLALCDALRASSLACASDEPGHRDGETDNPTQMSRLIIKATRRVVGKP